MSGDELLARFLQEFDAIGTHVLPDVRVPKSRVWVAGYDFGVALVRYSPLVTVPRDVVFCGVVGAVELLLTKHSPRHVAEIDLDREDHFAVFIAHRLLPEDNDQEGRKYARRVAKLLQRGLSETVSLSDLAHFLGMEDAPTAVLTRILMPDFWRSQANLCQHKIATQALIPELVAWNDDSGQLAPITK